MPRLVFAEHQKPHLVIAKVWHLHWVGRSTRFSFLTSIPISDRLERIRNVDKRCISGIHLDCVIGTYVIYRCRDRDMPLFRILDSWRLYDDLMSKEVDRSDHGLDSFLPWLLYFHTLGTLPTVGWSVSALITTRVASLQPFLLKRN